MKRWVSVPVLLLVAALGTAAQGAPPAPSGRAHPRIWLDAATRSAWQAQASNPQSGVGKAISNC